MKKAVSDWIDIDIPNYKLFYNVPNDIMVKFKVQDYDNNIQNIYKSLNYYSKQFKNYNKIIETEKQEEEETLFLTILPTYSCNLRCSYCFENLFNKNNKSGYSLVKLLSGIMKFIDHYLANNSCKKIKINWFGGEPTLEFDFIIRFMKILNSEFKNCLRIDYLLFTNGYLLEKKMCEELKENGLNSIHLTLDGDKNEHNKHKKTYLDLLDTFDVIFNNLILSLCYFNVTLRINVDKSNMHSINSLIEKIGNLQNKQNLFLDIRKLEPNKNSLINILSLEEFMTQYIDYVRLCLKNNLAIHIIPKVKNKYCSALKKHTYVIEPNGDIRKCWEEISNSETVYNNLFKPLENINEVKIWNRYSIGNTCQNCIMLSICRGGCPKDQIRYGRRRCLLTLECFKQLIKLKYEVINNKGM